MEANAGSHEITAVIAGSAGLVKVGGGEVIISGSNTYTGNTDVQNGTLRVRSIGSIDNSAAALNVGTDGNLILQGDQDSSGAGFAGTIVPDITGDGILTLSNSLTSETVTLNSAKTFAVVSTSMAAPWWSPIAMHWVPVASAIRQRRREHKSTAAAMTRQLQLTGGVTIASETLDLNDRNAGKHSCTLVQRVGQQRLERGYQSRYGRRHIHHRVAGRHADHWRQHCRCGRCC